MRRGRRVSARPEVGGGIRSPTRGVDGGVHSPSPSLAPVAGQERLAFVDALRGFALAGVLLANLFDFTLYSLLSGERQQALATGRIDPWFSEAIVVLLDGKAVTVFSMLFGLGFALQLERADARGQAARPFFLRRLASLFLFGIVNAYGFLWWGDILRFYAVFGVALLLFQRASDRALLWTGLGLALVAPGVLGPWGRQLVALLPPRPSVEAFLFNEFSAASYARAFHANLVADGYNFFFYWSFPFFLFGRFLRGAWAWRRGWVLDPAAHAAAWRRVFMWSLGLGLAGSVFIVVREPLALDARLPFLTSGWGKTLTGSIVRTATLGLGVAYASGLALLWLRARWRERLERLAPVGRMALTSYLAQSLVCIPLFFGFGANVGPRLGVVGYLGFGLALFALQVWFSHAWLARFHYGPAEWLWRWLTYGTAPAMRRVTTRAQVAGESL
jgi:uncharacterized protein